MTHMNEDNYQIARDAASLYPSPQECEVILQEHHLEESVLKHSRAVARVTRLIAEELNRRGVTVDTGLLVASALLHDIAKGQRNHPLKGQQIVASLGYPAVADIIACHMELPEHYVTQITEHSILYLADKMVQGDRIVSLETRLHQMMDERKDDAALQQIIARRIERALRIKRSIEHVLGSPLEKLAGLND